jgi:hypothetical protein
MDQYPSLTPLTSRTMRAMPAEATAWLGEATEAALPPPPAPEPARMPAGAVAADSEPLGRRWERLHSWSTSCARQEGKCEQQGALVVQMLYQHAAANVSACPGILRLDAVTCGFGCFGQATPAPVKWPARVR